MLRVQQSKCALQHRIVALHKYQSAVVVKPHLPVKVGMVLARGMRLARDLRVQSFPSPGPKYLAWHQPCMLQSPRGD